MQPSKEMTAHTTVQLFDGGRTDYRLYEASIEGDLEAAKVILQNHEYLVRYSITPNMERPLHIAILSQNKEFVSYLVNTMRTVDLELKNKDGNTAFCLAAISGYVDMAKIMVEKHPRLQIICGTENMTPLSLAAFHGKHEMVTFLYDLSDRMKDESWTEHRNEVLLKCIEANMLDVAIRILEDNEKLPQDNHVWDVLQVLAQNHGAFMSSTIISQIKSYCAFTGLVTRPKESKGVQLLRLLLKRVAEKPTDTIDKILRGPMIMKDETETYPSHILFIAAKMNKQFLVELIREFPDLIWQRNDDGQTIFHIAVAHRHHDVYKLLKNIGSMKDFIIPIADNKGNNILHMVGNLPEKIAYDDSETTPYEVLCEYFWYKEVESTLPPRYTQMKNKAGHTPEEEFIKGHKDVISKGIDWIYETINQSMVVAALVCTIGFSVVYSLPGGFDQNGFPIFRGNKTFIWFILVEAISFLLSGTSMLIFISIISSRHGNHKEILIDRWLAGQHALMASLGTMAIAFLSSVFLLYRDNILPYIISATAVLLVAIYIEEYHTFIKEAHYVTLKAMYLFRLKKYNLFHLQTSKF